MVGLRLGKQKDTILVAKIPKRLMQDKAYRLEDRRHTVPLVIADLDSNHSAGRQNLAGTCGDGSVAVEPIRSAIKRTQGIELPDFRLKRRDNARSDVRWV
jgi:hypothetical protein